MSGEDLRDNWRTDLQLSSFYICWETGVHIRKRVCPIRQVLFLKTVFIEIIILYCIYELEIIVLVILKCCSSTDTSFIQITKSDIGHRPPPYSVLFNNHDLYEIIIF